ncbi:MAG TPA: antitermination regulator, partial [Mycobacterium sp.]|nr:antitermination regulator [Mycobacterium sp.]
MVDNFDAQFDQPADGQTAAAALPPPVFDPLMLEELGAIHLLVAPGEPQRVGRFWFFLDGQR